MAAVPLSGVVIDVAHSLEASVVRERLQAFATDLAQNHFPEWGVQVERRDDGTLALNGQKGDHHFRADVLPETGRVKIALDGQIELGRIKLTLAGGPDGVRRRVSDEIGKALRNHLESA